MLAANLDKGGHYSNAAYRHAEAEDRADSRIYYELPARGERHAAASSMPGTIPGTLADGFT
jgi:hypothetical protein